MKQAAGVGSVRDTAGAWGGRQCKRLTRVAGPIAKQEEGRTQGWNGRVREEECRKRGRRCEQRGKASLG